MSDFPFLLSTVIVTYHNDKEIVTCLRSLTAEYTDISGEVILIDNASHDLTKEVIQRSMHDFPGRFQFIQNPVNRGFTKALNQGLAQAKGHYILTLNPDTQLSSGSVMQLISVLQEETNTAIIAPQLLNPDGSVQPSCRRFPRRRDVLFEVLGLSRLFPHSAVFNGWKMGDFDHNARRNVDQPQGACLLFRSELLQRLGIWDDTFPMFFSDVDWCHRVKQAGFEILFYPKVKVVHQKGISIFKRRPAMIWTSHRSFYHYLKKYRTNHRFLLANEIVGIILGLVALLRMAGAVIRKPKTG